LREYHVVDECRQDHFAQLGEVLLVGAQQLTHGAQLPGADVPLAVSDGRGIQAPSSLLQMLERFLILGLFLDFGFSGGGVNFLGWQRVVIQPPIGLAAALH
jgi:hypothetical protein